MTSKIVIVIEPLPTPLAPRRGNLNALYRVRLASDDGEILLQGVRTPLFDAARELLRRGIEPSTMLVMRHKGSPITAMWGTVGRLATLTVTEGDKKGPVITAWKPFSADAVNGRTASDG